jgi:hypothetical protein
MWAVLDIDNETVVGVILPDVPEEKALKQTDPSRLIKMTIENSPAYMQGTYKDGKFYPKKEGN